MQCGWPTKGSTYASIETARRFNSDFTKRCISGQGTPAHFNRTLGCFLFELLDEDLKETGPGPFETSWGVFNETVRVLLFLRFPLNCASLVSCWKGKGLGVEAVQNVMKPSVDWLSPVFKRTNRSSDTHGNTQFGPV